MKLLLIILLVLSSISFANFFCFQSSATIANQVGTDGSCGLLYTGAYNTTFVYEFPVMVSPGYGNFSVNYTKPLLATNQSKWTVAFGLPAFTYQNLSIPIACWNADPTLLQFRFTSYEDAITPNMNSSAECFDGTTWNVLASSIGTTRFFVGLTCVGPGGDVGNWHNGNPNNGSFAHDRSDLRACDDADGGFGNAFIYDNGMYWDVPEVNNTLQIFSPGEGTTYLNPFPVPINIQSITTFGSVCNAFINGALIGTFNYSFTTNISGAAPLIIGVNNISANCTYGFGTSITVNNTFNYILPTLTGNPFELAFDKDISVCPIDTFNELSFKCIEYYKIPSVFNFSAVPCVDLNLTMNLSCLDPFFLSNVTKIGPFNNYTIFYTPAYWNYSGAIGHPNKSLELTGAEFVYNSKFITHNPCNPLKPLSCGPQGMELIDNDSFMYVPAQFKPVDCGYYYTSLFGTQCSYGYGFIVNNRIIAVSDNKNQWYTAAGLGTVNNSLIPPAPVIYVNVVPLPGQASDPFANGMYTTYVCTKNVGNYTIHLTNTIPQTYTVFIFINNTGMINITSFSVRSTDLNSIIPTSNVVAITVYDNVGKVCSFSEQQTLFLPFDLGPIATDGFTNFIVKMIAMFGIVIACFAPFALIFVFIFNDLYPIFNIGDFAIIVGLVSITGIVNTFFSPQRGIKNMVVVMAVCLAYLMLLQTRVQPYIPDQFGAVSGLIYGISQFTTSTSLSDQIIGFGITFVNLIIILLTLPLLVFNFISGILIVTLPPVIATPLVIILTFLGYGASIWFDLKGYEIVANRFQNV